MAGEKSGDQDAPSIGLFDLVDGTFSASDLDLMRSLPRRALPVIVHGLPAWLEGLADSDPVRLFEAGSDRLGTAGSVRAMLLATQNRQVHTGLHHTEVAQLLTDALARSGFARAVPAARIERAFERGELVFFDEVSHDQANPSAGLDLPMSLLHYGCYTTPEHVTAWLQSNPPPVPGLTACPPGPWSEALPCQQQQEAPEAAPVLVPGAAGGEDSPDAAPATEGVGRREKVLPDRRDAILVALKEGGYDPLDLPPWYFGQEQWEAKKCARDGTTAQMDGTAFEKTWQDLWSTKSLGPESVKKGRRKQAVGTLPKR